MIKAQELRRGNWIMYKGQPIQVTTIGEYGIQSKTADSTINAKFQFDISPIPLTPELLGKIKDATFSSSEQCLAISLEGVSEKLFYWHYSKTFNMSGGRELIKNELHHLQNYIYANYGTELEITL